jgi:hypothetical protein
VELGINFIQLLDVLVAEKQLVLREEPHIRHCARSDTVEVPVTLRKQRTVVERIDPGRAEKCGITVGRVRLPG